jgi:hypothetical protein
MNETAVEFGLQDKKSSMSQIKAQMSSKLASCLHGAERFSCVAHGLHNLIMVDGISIRNEVQNIISKVKDIIKTFTFDVAMWEKEAEDYGTREGT